MLGLLGDEWTLLVMQQSLLGAARFGEFRSRLPISNSVLTARLRTLTAERLLERHEYQINPQRFEYRLTSRGRSLWPVLLSIWEWERHWVPDHAAPLPGMRHAACRADFAPAVNCHSCGRAARGKDVVAQWGPSGSWQRSIPSSVTRRRSEPGQHAGASLFPQTMSVLGNRWGFALLVAAFVGVRRFTDFQSQLGAPPGSIADRLSIFTGNEVMVAAGSRYELTEKGAALFPVLITALQWAQRWFPDPKGPAVVLTHRACGGPFTAALVCDRCGEPLRGTQVWTTEIPEKKFWHSRITSAKVAGAQ
ncbi:helix-turn-helix domain-containing protein [Mycobacterium sp. E740]|uniref:winged helix-turn-helix transcriptional regulator n=1 Tax=Mycobacterium sp. E740 TaxID=1834149 RepID=UPI0009ECDA36|nr:winged helix-turn-helix transcriptional regulator [Mycobacterium sp. E740]